MRYFLFIGIFGLMHYYIVCAKLVLALVYCNFLKEVRLGGWGTEGPKALTLGRHASECATILRLRALLCCVRCISACATIPLGSGSIYLVLRLG